MASPRMALGDDPRGIRDVSEGDQLAAAQLDRAQVHRPPPTGGHAEGRVAICIEIDELLH